jgi:hypothetical protein
MGDHSQEPAQDQVGHAVGGVTVDEIGQPLPIARMVGRIFAMRVDQDVNVDQDHQAAR